MASWFPVGRNNPSGWRLDIVGLLAVTGESFMVDHAQAITSSRLSLWPRIMPAPHALLRALRPKSLPSVEAKVIKIDSGEMLDTVIRITCPKIHVEIIRACSISFGFNPHTTSSHRERRTHIVTKGRYHIFREWLNKHAPRLDGKLGEYVPALTFSPLNIISFFNCLLTIGLIVAGCFWKDGTAVVAVALLSIASSIISYGAYWTPVLPNYPIDTPPKREGDIVIRTLEDAFIIVQCSEDVAAELYSRDQNCYYKFNGAKYRVLMMTGAVFIMPSVILLGNCSFNMQVLCGVSYIVLNIVYWGLGLLPQQYSWDLSRYMIDNITPLRNRYAHSNVGDGMPSYERTLWYAIRETNQICRSGENGWQIPSP
ncbi:hypothetical protein M434DRAFT_28561 [Hypoxylon sp. CO27-5]|nr:hypothetical protein M434DRAFT_28561 [Hypoxylon sp. CO27-5]